MATFITCLVITCLVSAEKFLETVNSNAQGQESLNERVQGFDGFDG